MLDFMYFRDPKLVKKIGEATALEVRATGIPYVFAPCIAVIEHYYTVHFQKFYNFTEHSTKTVCYLFLQVCRDPRWGRCYESYSEDHKIVQAMTELIPGLQGDMPPSAQKGAPFVSTAK